MHGLLSMSRSSTLRLEHVVTYLLLLSGTAVICLPFFWMISTSLKQQMDVYLFPPQWIPQPIQWDNYRQVMTFWPFWTFVWNSLIVTTGSIAGKLMASSVAAYGFARLRAPGRDAIFIILLSTMMLPSQVTLIPQFILFSKLRWIDTFKPLVVPAFFLGPFYVFLLRQFFMTLSFELEDAARMDGCNSIQVFYRVILPLSMPALAIVAIFEFRARWNDFLEPLIYLNTPAKRTLALALQFFQGSEGVLPQLHLLMAASFLSMLPLLILFTVAQKRFIQGIVFTGIKG